MNDEYNSEEYLSAHGLRKTPFRIELLELFMKNKHSLSHHDIKENIQSTKDKVTIYRALDSFLEKGLLHKVPDANNVSKYALCSSQCSHEKHEHNHAHFICNNCEKTYCIETIKLPLVKNTEGFRITNSKLTLEGECPDCIAKETE